MISKESKDEGKFVQPYEGMMMVERARDRRALEVGHARVAAGEDPETVARDLAIERILAEERDGLDLRVAGDVAGHEFHGNQWTTAYHGTAADNVNSIKRTGIKLSKYGSVHAVSQKMTYVTLSLKRAIGWAKDAAEGHNYAVFKVRVPKRELKRDYNSGWKQDKALQRDVPPSWIKKAVIFNGKTHEMLRTAASVEEDGEDRYIVIIFDDENLKTAAAPSPLHAAADDHVEAVAATVKAAFKKGQDAVTKTTLVKAVATSDVDAAIEPALKAVEAVLTKHLAARLLDAATSGGQVAVRGLAKLKAAGDVAGHEFHGNQWTGGAAALDVRRPMVGIIDRHGVVQAKNATAAFNTHDQLFGDQRPATQRFTVERGGDQVVWDDEPSHDDMLAVEDFFAEYRKHIAEHVPGYYGKSIPAVSLQPPKVLGGPGSGNFDHVGRPGEVGGSGLTGSFVKGTAEQAKALGLPPAWKHVRINPDPNGHILATGVDVKGRVQYRYSAKHNEDAKVEKFGRVKEFGQTLPGLRSQIEKDMAKGDDAATILSLIDKTSFRVGSDRDTLANAKAYGASTLEARHVTIDGDMMTFSFVGKKGTEIEQELTDAALAKALRPRVEAGGRLFEPGGDTRVREYMNEHASGFTPKDFRTWNATSKALQLVKSMGTPSTQKEFKAMRKAVGEAVGKTLGHSKGGGTVALGSYISPVVFAKWQAKL